MQDELLDSDEYYTPPCPKELKQPKEKKQKEKDEPAPRSLKAKRKQLDAWASDPKLDFSDRQDAARLHEVAEINLYEFNRRFAELRKRINTNDDLQPSSGPNGPDGCKPG